MVRWVIAALMVAAASLSAAAAQSAPAHDHVAHARAQAAQPQPSAATPQGHSMGGMIGQGAMTGGTVGHNHTMMKDSQACDCPCMKQDQGAEEHKPQ